MLALIASLISGVISGGATGLLGILIQRFFDLKGRDKDIAMLQLQHAQTLALAQIESERARIRADADTYIADRQLEATEAEADSRSLVASYENDKATYLSKEAQGTSKWVTYAFAFVDVVRGLIRPLLTAYLVVLATAMFIWVKSLAGDNTLNTDQVLKLMESIISTLLYLVTACTLWWFGSRPPKKG